MNTEDKTREENGKLTSESLAELIVDALIDATFVNEANFDDALITEAIENHDVIYSIKATEAIKELDLSINDINESRTPEEVINDPKMQIVREKAAKALELILASDCSESTVEIFE